VSIFKWLFSKPAAQPKPVTPAPRQVVPQKTPAPAGSAVGAELKQLRQDRRDHLYSVVRDVMLRSEVLASHYKFKVLSLDTQGRQFLVMIDLLGEQSLLAGQLAGIEALISSTAAQRYALIVKSVYWRQAEPAGVAAAVPVVAPAVAPVHAATPSVAPATHAAALHDVDAPTPRGRGGAKSQGFDPIGADEVLAFKKAIAAGPATPAPAVGAASVSGLRNAAAMTGFEDTQLMEPDDPVSPLSGTQFGDL